jgi:hypothetical protein
VVAAEHDPASAILPFRYQSTFQKPTHVKGLFSRYGAQSANIVKCDLSRAVATLNGSPLNLIAYMNAWVTEAINQSMLTFPSGTLADGTYERECKSERTFAEGVFTINEAVVQIASITAQFEIYLVRPAVKSHFEVNGRGRVISFEAHTVGNVTFNEVQFILGPEPIR